MHHAAAALPAPAAAAAAVPLLAAAPDSALLSRHQVAQKSNAGALPRAPRGFSLARSSRTGCWGRGTGWEVRVLKEKRRRRKGGKEERSLLLLAPCCHWRRRLRKLCLLSLNPCVQPRCANLSHMPSGQHLAPRFLARMMRECTNAFAIRGPSPPSGIGTEDVAGNQSADKNSVWMFRYPIREPQSLMPASAAIAGVLTPGEGWACLGSAHREAPLADLVCPAFPG